ncbi:uncharacterized protein TNCV_2651191 [Trichonephila clavipes]|nr:uncharacterized protein TNCV_2651191 [Trichonephila clavipes]
MPKSNAQIGKVFREKEKKRNTRAASPVEKVTRKKKQKQKKTQKNIANLLSVTAESPSEYMREYRTRKKTVQNTLLMLSLRDGNAIETLLMTAQINTDLVNHLVPLTTEPSTILVGVGIHACKAIINSILHYKDYDSHKNAHKDFQKPFIDNRSIDTGVQFMIDYGLETI